MSIIFSIRTNYGMNYFITLKILPLFWKEIMICLRKSNIMIPQILECDLFLPAPGKNSPWH